MPNRLASSSSPYLLQHANNPVDWWPWGEEALSHAVTNDLPVFLSIGYSTCYWCHVMERESFEDDEIAALLNANFVCIKLDREERPDLDELYMAATIAMNGHGGWPMSIFLDPATRNPFYCGTYFPAKPMHGRPAFPQLLLAMSNAWTTQRAGVIEQAAQVAETVAEHAGASPPHCNIGSQQVTDAVSQLLRSFDRINGGFGSAPKFPQVTYLDYLMEVRSHAADEVTADAVNEALRRTLDSMLAGGIHDQLAGGFHRYSVDATWTVPHFEKMLYDNALLASIYARASAAYGDEQYTRVARRTCDYVLAEMTDGATGLFYSAQDAAVDGREGQNYLWTVAQVQEALPPNPEAPFTPQDDAAFAIQVYGLRDRPGFQDPHHPSGDIPTHVLRLTDRPDRLAKQLNLPLPSLLARLDSINVRLLLARAARPQPSLDDKCIACWNGLMISALAIAAETLDEPRYLNAALRAADSARTHLFSNGRLLRSLRQGVPGPLATLEDHAALASAMLAVDRAATKLRPAEDFSSYTTFARTLLDAIATNFTEHDSTQRMLRLFDAPADQTDGFIRPSVSHDGATPSGTSLTLNALLDLHEQLGDAQALRTAVEMLVGVSARIAASPVSAINSVRALLRVLLQSDDAMQMLSQVTPDPAAAQVRGQQAINPVEVFAAVERINLSDVQPHAIVTVLVKVERGWHINAASAPTHPLRVHIVNGTGVDIFCDYPQPHEAGKPGSSPLQAPGAAAPVRAALAGSSPAPLIYRGEIELTLVLERTDAAAKGNPLIAITYQACSDEDSATSPLCLPPTTVELDIALDITHNITP